MIPGQIPGLVDQELSRFLAEQRTELSSIAPGSLMMLDEIGRLIAAGGKRIRPLFCYWGFRAAGGAEGPEIVRAGAAVELLHTSAIIHDDLVDGSALRRGRPTSHLELSAGGGEEFGRAAAILAGDLAQALADTLLASSGFTPDRILAGSVYFNRMRVEAVSGEFLDLLAATRGEATEAEARLAAQLKSGSYSVTGPLLVGAALAGGNDRVAEVLGAYGRPLGEVFQLRDDLLSTFGEPGRTGKDVDADIREGKQTTLLVKARKLGSEATQRLLGEVGRGDADPDQVERAREAIRTSGAVEETIELIDSLAAEAKAALAGASLDGEVVRELEALADRLAATEL